MPRQAHKPNLLSQLGRILQLAYVPADFDAALDHWSNTMGVGPFFMLKHLQLTNTRYRAEPSDIDMSAAVGYWGDIQIELIQQHNDAPSSYRDWLSKGGTGIQHYGIVVDDFAAAHGALTRMGGTAIQETEVPGLVKVSYFELPGQPQLIEILGSTPGYQSLINFMRAAASGWDGADPVRELPPDRDWSQS
jgi:hypothetical protein